MLNRIKLPSPERGTSESGKGILLPWPLIAAAALGDVALYIYTQGNVAALALAVAMVLTRVLPFRIPHTSWFPWVIRVVAYGLIQTNMPRADDGHIYLFQPQNIGLLGMIWALEAAIQAWRERPWGNPPGASVMLFSMMGYIAACTTQEDGVFQMVDGRYVIYMTPVYMLLLVLGMRGLRRAGASVATSSGVESTPRRWMRIIRAVAIVEALAIGFACWLPLHLYNQQINDWGNSLFSNQPPPEPTGLSTAPSLGSMFNGQGSPTRVLRLVGYDGDPHLHGLTFDTYHRGQWLPTVDRRQFAEVSSAQLHSDAAGSRTSVYGFTDNLKVLLGPLDTAGLTAPDGYTAERSDDPSPAYQSETLSPYRYQIISYPSPPNQPSPLASLPSRERGVAMGDGVFNGIPTTAERARCLAVPQEIAPGVRALARRIGLAAGPTPQSKIDAVTGYLLKNYSYSLSVTIGPGDPVSDFLLHQKAAHCEYFGSSAVMLLRLLDVPARYVTGYYAHEDEDGAIVVRQRDSHAWCEAFIDGQGWVTVDATPGGGLPSSLYHDTPVTWKIGEWFGDRIAEIQVYLSRFTPAQLSLGIAGLSALFYLGRMVLVRRRRRPAQQSTPTYAEGPAELAALAARFDTFLKSQGAPCPPDRPWQEHLAQLERQDEVALAVVDIDQAEVFVTEYNALRFRREFDDEQLAYARNTLRSLVSKSSDRSDFSIRIERRLE